MGLDLREYRKPLEAVTFPNGAQHMPRLFESEEYQLWRDMLSETDSLKRVALCVQIIVACYPTVTNADLLDCNAEMLIDLAAYPGGKIEWVRAMLKNADAVAAAATPPPKPEAVTTPSSPKTSGNTSSRSTRKRSAKTGGESTTTSDPTTSGSPSTTSQSLGESTPYAVSWKTSTAPASPASP